MFKINIITLFPAFFVSPLKTSLLERAIQRKLLKIEIIPLREFGLTSYKKVDDAPYGGGAGMILMIEPIDNALSQVKRSEKTYTILLTPRGENFTQKKARELFAKVVPQQTANNEAGYKSLSLICGHYEGIDQRISERLADESISVGDFILSGGETAAMVLIDSISRLIPGFMNNQNSLLVESFYKEGYIEYPQYTRPGNYKNMTVPDVLLKGNHQEIKKWKLENSKKDSR